MRFLLFLRFSSVKNLEGAAEDRQDLRRNVFHFFRESFCSAPSAHLIVCHGVRGGPSVMRAPRQQMAGTPRCTWALRRSFEDQERALFTKGGSGLCLGGGGNLYGAQFQGIHSINR